VLDSGALLEYLSYMQQILNLGQDIILTGKSGAIYRGRILDKECTTLSTSHAIACLTNSHYADGQWHHHFNSVYNTDNEKEAVEQFQERQDITHLILIPRNLYDLGKLDKIQDLIRNYIHQ
jgi:hypothetical protein